MCLSLGVDWVGNLWKKSGENYKFWAFSRAGFLCFDQCLYFGHNLLISYPI